MIINLPDWCLYQSSNGCHDAEHHFLRQLSTEKEKKKIQNDYIHTRKNHASCMMQYAHAA